MKKGIIERFRLIHLVKIAGKILCRHKADRGWWNVVWGLRVAGPCNWATDRQRRQTECEPEIRFREWFPRYGLVRKQSVLLCLLGCRILPDGCDRDLPMHPPRSDGDIFWFPVASRSRQSSGIAVCLACTWPSCRCIFSRTLCRRNNEPRPASCLARGDWEHRISLRRGRSILLHAAVCRCTLGEERVAAAFVCRRICRLRPGRSMRFLWELRPIGSLPVYLLFRGLMSRG